MDSKLKYQDPSSESQQLKWPVWIAEAVARQFYSQQLSSIGLAAVAAVVSIGTQSMPAQADELREWGYDSQTRSLNFVLPNSVTPSVSVLSPDRLLLELPDTQVGDVTSQRVGDGVVETITVEQSTAETVWMVIEFVPGTVLADAQNVTVLSADPAGQIAPSGDSDQSSQQWQIRPALLASDPTANLPATVADTDLNPATTSTDSAAASLRLPAVDVAQSPEFSELPVLEPSMPLNQSVSVPPLDASPIAPPTELPPIEADRSVAEITIPAEPVPVEVAPVEVAPADATSADEMPMDLPVVGEAAVENAELPSVEPPLVEPPFIGEIGSDPTALSVPEIDVTEADVAATEENGSAETAETTVETAAAVSPDESDGDEPQDDISAEIVRPANVDRWPDPVPFGQPLP